MLPLLSVSIQLCPLPGAGYGSAWPVRPATTQKWQFFCFLRLKILAGVHQPCYSLPALPPGASYRKGGTMHPWALQSSPGRTHGAGVARGTGTPTRAQVTLWNSPASGDVQGDALHQEQDGFELPGTLTSA